MTHTNKLVQLIAVQASSHLETCAAVAIASCLAHNTYPQHPTWDDWLTHDYTKTVRRISKQAHINALKASTLQKVEYQLGNAHAWAFCPMTYDDTPKPLRRLQVSGLNGYTTVDTYYTDVTTKPTITIHLNPDLNMSTGKAAAQTAHALSLYLRMLTTQARDEWLTQPALVVSLSHPTSAPTITVKDNGLTELEPGTTTAWVCKQ